MARTELEKLKNRAKRIKKDLGIQHARALDMAAQERGFNNFTHAIRALPQESG